MTTLVKTLSTGLALCLGAGVLAGCAANGGAAETPAQVASRAPDPCFRSGDITNVNIVDERTLYVSTRRGYVYRLNSPGGCYVQGARITVGQFSGGRGQGTCVGGQATVASGSSVCIAEITGPYTDSRQSGLWSRTAAP